MARINDDDTTEALWAEDRILLPEDVYNLFRSSTSGAQAISAQFLRGNPILSPPFDQDAVILTTVRPIPDNAAIRNVIASFLREGTNVTLTRSGNRLTIASSVLGIRSVTKTGGVTTITLTDGTTHTINDGDDGEDGGDAVVADPLTFTSGELEGEFSHESVGFIRTVNNFVTRQSYLQDEELSIANLASGQRSEVLLTSTQLQFEVDGTHLEASHVRIDATGIKLGGVRRTTWPSGSTGLTAEQVRDTIASFLVAGTNITSIVHNDSNNTLTINAATQSGSGGGGGIADVSGAGLYARSQDNSNNRNWSRLIIGTNLSVDYGVDNGVPTWTLNATCCDDDDDDPDPDPAPTIHPQLLISGRSFNVNEGSSITVPVRLDRAPDSTVTVSISESHADLSVSPSSMTFTSTNWNTAQDLTITAAQDADIADDENIPVTLSPDDTDIDDVRLSVTIIDDDEAGTGIGVAGFEFNNIGLSTTLDRLEFESDGTGVFEWNVNLLSKPTGNVTVTVSLTNIESSIYTINTPSLQFTPLNYQTTQTVRVTFTELPDYTPRRAKYLRLTAAGANYDSQEVRIIVQPSPDGSDLPAPSSLSLAFSRASTYSDFLYNLFFNVPVSQTQTVASGSLNWRISRVSINFYLFENVNLNARLFADGFTAYSSFDYIAGTNFIELNRVTFANVNIPDNVTSVRVRCVVGFLYESTTKNNYTWFRSSRISRSFTLPSS